MGAALSTISEEDFAKNNALAKFSFHVSPYEPVNSKSIDGRALVSLNGARKKKKDKKMN